MAKISDVEIPSLLFTEGSAPATPASGFGRLYVKTTGLHFKGDDGAEVGPLAGSGGGGPSADGWTTDTATWTYASATTFTIAGVDVTAKFKPGTYLKLTQTTVKYFVVVSSAFATDTTVTIAAGSDYTLANAAITAPYYSYQANPQGWPGWFTFAPAAAGFSGSPTYAYARFSVVGRICYVHVDISGTSNATTFSYTAPVAIAASGVNAQWNYGINNGGGLATGGLVSNTGSTQIDVYRDCTAGVAWTNTGTKRAAMSIFYEI